MPPPDRNIRIVAALIVTAGLTLSGLAILAEELGIGGAPGTFGWKQITLLVVGGLAVAVGALLLTRPRIVSRLITSQRIGQCFARPAVRRWLVLAALVVLAGLLGGLSIPRLTDRLIEENGGTDVPTLEPTPAPSPQEQFRAAQAAFFRDALTEVCERHLPRLRQIGRRGYRSATADRPRLLRDTASAISAVRTDLRSLDVPPELAATYSRFLHGVTRLVAAHRGTAAALDKGDEAAEERHFRQVLAAASVASDAAAELWVGACDSG